MKTSDRIYLRDVREQDKNLFLDWLNDKETTKYLNILHPINEDTQIVWMERLKNDKSMRVFMICLSEGDKAIGSISLNKINQRDKNAELTAFIGIKEERGHGLGTEATGLVIDYAFNHLKLHRIYTGAYDFNTASIKSLAKSGFLQEGLLRHSICRNGSYHDTLIFGLLNSS